MKQIEAPKGWAQLLLTPPPTPWAALRSALAAGPAATMQTLIDAGLRGRGGGGFLTGEKWRVTGTSEAEAKYAVANGYESDPAVFTNRLLLEKNAQAVVEGLAAAALAVGAREAFIAVRAEYTEAIRGLEAIIHSAERDGVLGANVLGSGRELVISVRPLQGSSMIGEETVLLKALAGKRGQPEQTPPYPATVGYLGKPTVVNNVATLAAVTWIMNNGAAAFKQIGDSAEPGTALVQISGSLASAGVMEVPTGTPLAEILAAAGGPTKGTTIKALLIGGPSGGFVPVSLLASTPYSGGGLATVGAHIGSGGLLAIDQSVAIPELAAMLTRWCADEACGKTIPCRIGTRRLAEIGQRFVDGLAGPKDVQKLHALAADVADSALCAHERLTPSPLLTGMRYFEREFVPTGVVAEKSGAVVGRSE
ncbi:MAG: NADH-ubiquinone oxidoreductase-F iron-sulfur binding region domain-containing protein [Chloroflexota bacterium]